MLAYSQPVTIIYLPLSWEIIIFPLRLLVLIKLDEIVYFPVPLALSNEHRAAGLCSTKLCP